MPLKYSFPFWRAKKKENVSFSFFYFYQTDDYLLPRIRRLKAVTVRFLSTCCNT